MSIADARKAASASGDPTFTYEGTRYATSPRGARPPKPPGLRGMSQEVYDGIASAATALQIPPSELATIIAFETGGTMDPMQPGPTTKWGQHRGFIQFGEPQAKSAGIDFTSRESAIATQLGADGGIVNYALSSGFVPGEMDALQLYATINGGNPNAVGARDAAAGGTPGTVADKYYTQMAPFREQANSTYGSDFVPNASEGATGGSGTGVDANGPVGAEAGETGIPADAGPAARMKLFQSLAGEYGDNGGGIYGGGSVMGDSIGMARPVAPAVQLEAWAAPAGGVTGGAGGGATEFIPGAGFVPDTGIEPEQYAEGGNIGSTAIPM